MPTCACIPATTRTSGAGRQYGLIELFDIARVHLGSEHVWRKTDVWPTEDAPHGITKPARRRPELKVTPLRATAVEAK